MYIGEAYRKQQTGKRFSQHISCAIDKGGDTGSNYALSMYYWNNHEIVLDIYILENYKKRKDVEKDLLKTHVKKYGALPIAQGSTGKNYTPKTLNVLDTKFYSII